METKEIKLNSYTLPDRVKAKMIITLFKTHQAKKEKSITFCTKLDNIIIAKGDFTGSSDRVEIDSRMCNSTMNRLFLDEKYIKELDKDLDKKELQLLTLKESGVSEHEIEEAGIDLFNDTIKYVPID